LEEIRHNGIMEWILDRRGNDDLPNGKEKGNRQRVPANYFKQDYRNPRRICGLKLTTKLKLIIISR
jgi:hypothetical protein